MDIAPANTPANAPIHRKSTSFDNIVRTLSTLKGLHNSYKLIHFMIQKIPVDTIYALQEAQSLSTSVQNWLIGVTTLELQELIDGNMDKVMTEMSNEPTK